MAKVIVGIHGLANKPPKAKLTEFWTSSIREGLEKNCKLKDAKFTFRMVFWADLLHKHRLHDDANFDFDKLYNKEPYVAGKNKGPFKRHDDTAFDTFLAGVFGLAGDALDIAKERFDMDKVADWVLGKVLKDLDFYYDPKRRIADRSKPPKLVLARRALMDELTKALLPLKGQDIMLIAHSMGTIIAYDVLSDLGRKESHPDFEVEQFVTIGSPLGLPHVKKKIIDEREYRDTKKEANRVRTPSVVTGSWKNYADRKDPVALDVHLRDDYTENRHGVRVVDDIVANTYLSPAGEPNHHKSYGYLRTPEVSEQIRDFLA